MDFKGLQKKARNLSRKVSRFQLAQLKEQAEQGKGVELSGLTRYERGKVTGLYERERERRGC